MLLRLALSFQMCGGMLHQYALMLHSSNLGWFEWIN